jgi:hypothetical protein
MSFNPSHIFTLSGKLIQGNRRDSHENILLNNRETILPKKTFIHGSVYYPTDKNGIITHYLNYSINDNLPNSDLNYSRIGERAKPSHYEPTLRTILNHYSKTPEKKFKVVLGIGDEENLLHPVLRRHIRATGKGVPSPFDGYVELTSIDEIQNFLNNNKAEVKIRRSSREFPTADTSRLGQRLQIPQGNMSTAERKYWETLGLGDSYIPIMKFKEYINENI